MKPPDVDTPLTKYSPRNEYYRRFLLTYKIKLYTDESIH